MKLGQKIRRMRKMRGFTQTDLAGDRITRNMLSQIESGAALPSIQTIIYLSERLDVPAGYFLSDSDDDLAYKKIKCLGEIKAAYKSGDYAACIDMVKKKLGEADDEISLILAECNLYLGEQHFSEGAFATCSKYLRASLSHCEKTAYSCSWIRARALLFLSATEDIDLPLHNIGGDYELLAHKSISYETFLYMRTLLFADNRNEQIIRYIFDNHKFENPTYRAHIGAKLLMSEGRFLAAADAINNILNKQPKENISTFVKYKLYADLESCYRETNDFEGAYRYATKRLSLISRMKS